MDLRQEIQELYKEIRENPSNFSCLKTDELLSAYENKNNKYLENKTNKDIENEKLQSFNIDNLQTNLTFDVFLQKMLLRMDKIKDKNIEYFRSKFKTHLRDQKLNDLLNGK